MNGKKPFYSEAAYLLGLFILAMGTALMEKADFGMSMVVAPAYLTFLKVSQFLPWFTFGMAEYCLQALLLLILGLLLRRFKAVYLFSFCTAVIYGFVLDFCIGLVRFFSAGSFAARCGCFLAGLVLCSVGVALLFRTYISPEAYELLVKEAAQQLQKKISVVKTVYDCCSCAAAIIMSFAFFGFGNFQGVKLGTVLCALVNGWLIGRIDAWMKAHWEMRDAFPLRKYFI